MKKGAKLPGSADVIKAGKKKYKKKTILPIKPKTRLGAGEKEILWTLVSLGNMDEEKLQGYIGRSIRTSIRRLKKKKLVYITQKKKVMLSPVGEGIILHYALSGKSWEGWRKIPKVNSKFKLVAFDLDDTLIPGFVTRNVDVETMRRILLTLKRNGIRTTVLSINPDTTVYTRLRNHGLLHLIDFPFQTQKTAGMNKLLKVTGYKPEEILFVGHDINSDWFGIKNAHDDIPIVLFKDAFSFGDWGTKIPKVKGALIVDRDYTTFLKILEGKIKETDDKKKLIDDMHKLQAPKKKAYIISAGDLDKFKIGDLVKIDIHTAKYFPLEKERKGEIGTVYSKTQNMLNVGFPDSTHTMSLFPTEVTPLIESKQPTTVELEEVGKKRKKKGEKQWWMW